MSPTDTCKDCGCKDSIGHRLTEGGEGPTTWGWTKSIIARILRTTAANIPDEWLVRPQISLWPPQRHRSVLWVLTRCVLPDEPSMQFDMARPNGLHKEIKMEVVISCQVGPKRSPISSQL